MLLGLLSLNGSLPNFVEMSIINSKDIRVMLIFPLFFSLKLLHFTQPSMNMLDQTKPAAFAIFSIGLSVGVFLFL